MTIFVINISPELHNFITASIKSSKYDPKNIKYHVQTCYFAKAELTAEKLAQWNHSN